jgi:hypothetical protein
MSNCILWDGAIQNNGYGQIRREGKLYLTHRWFYAQAHGMQMSELSGKVVRHTCDVRACRNPEHLILGSQSQNMHDKKRPGKVVKKLTREDAAAIKVRLDAGEIMRTIAEDYGVSITMIHNIKRGTAWRTEDLPAT